jgi:predicted transcriptional regulator
MAAEELTSLTLDDYSDIELLEIVLDEINEETGYAKTPDIAKRIGITGDHPNQSVGGRLAYLHGIGATAYKKPKQWAVTQIGMDLINADLRAAQRSAIDLAKDSEILQMARRFGRRAQESPLPAVKMSRRELRREL